MTNNYFSPAWSRGRCDTISPSKSSPVVDGDIVVPEEPGLGLDLGEDVVAKYPVG